MEAMNFTRVSILNSTVKANVVPRFAPLSFSQKSSQVCFITSSSKQSQKKHAIQVTNCTKKDDPAGFVVDKIKEANEKLNKDVSELKAGTDNLVGKAFDNATNLKDDIEAKANETAGKTSESAGEVKDNVKQNNEDLKTNIEAAAAVVAEKTEEGKGDVEKLAGTVVEKTNEAVVNALDASEGTTKKIKEAFVDATQEKKN